MMNTSRTAPTVLVGVDGSKDALRAVRWAAPEAQRRRLPLRLVHAFAWVAEPDSEVLTGGEHYRDMMLERARGYLRSAAAVASEIQPGIVVQQQLIVGYAAEILLAEAHRAELIVLGDRGLNRIEGVLIGSNAAAMVAHAACPVVVVRGAELDDDEAWTRPVLLGVDDSPSSEAAIGFAFEAAAVRGVPLLAVHAYAEPVADPLFGKFMDWDVIARDEQQRLAAHLAGWSEKFPAVAIQQVSARERPVHQLLDLSKTAQLAVVGSRGRGRLTGLLLGSVSNALIHQAACPVAVIRPGTVTSHR